MSMRQEPCSMDIFLFLHNITRSNALWISSPLKLSHGSAGHVLANLNLMTITVLFLVTSHGNLQRQTVVTSFSCILRLCTTEKTTGPNRCAQTRERHQTKLPARLQWQNEGNELCRNAGKRTGKVVWLGTDSENIQAEDSGKFIQISSDYLLSVTKYEAPANAIEQKSTKQKRCFIQSPGTSGFVQQRYFILDRESMCSSLTNDPKYDHYTLISHCKIVLCINNIN